MTVLMWIVFGFFVGVVAKFVMPGRDPGGFIVTILLGIGGALLGGFLGSGPRTLSGRGRGGLHHGGARRAPLARPLSGHWWKSAAGLTAQTTG